MKRKICLLVLLALLICGCAAQEPIDDRWFPFGDPEVNVQYLPEIVENPDDLPVLKWVCLTDFGTGGGNRIWSEPAVHQLNEMLGQRNMPFRVQFVMLTLQNVAIGFDWLEQPEAKEALEDADLIFGYLSSQDMVKYLMPITEFAKGEAEPTLENAVPFEVCWSRGRVNGEIYGISGYCSVIPESTCWHVDPIVLSEYGFTAEDFQGKRFWEMDEVFAQLYEKNGNRGFLSCLGSSSYEQYEDGQANVFLPAAIGERIGAHFDDIGGFYAVDYSMDPPAVVSIVESDYARNYQQAAVRYRDSLYMANSSEALITYYNAKTDFVAQTDSRIIIPAEPLYLSDQQGCGYVSGVAASTRCKEEALSLLSLIAEDAVFRMHMAYGKEGQDYSVDEDGYYTVIRNEDGSCYSLDFLFSLNYYSGFVSDQMSSDNSDLYSPSTRHRGDVVQEGKTLWETHRDLIDRAILKYPLNGYPADKAVNPSALIFDFSGCTKELEMLEEMCLYYFPFYNSMKSLPGDSNTDYEDASGQQLTKDMYDQMLLQLRNAGSEKVLKALQKQLEAWQKKYPEAG